MRVTIKSEEELIEVAQEAIRILVNLRHSSKAWEEDYGVEKKRSKKKWEEAADRFVSKLQTPDLTRNEHIKIEIKHENESN